MPDGLAERLQGIVRAEGPVPFTRWMQECLYHPEWGYYMRPGRKTGPGHDADFVTPPTLHPFFGAAIGADLANLWEALGKPEPFRVLERGGGEGHLARNAVAWTKGPLPELSKAIVWLHDEASPGHRAAQASTDPRIRPDDGGPVHAIVLCEFVDAQPFPLVAAGRKVLVGLEGGRFTLVGRGGAPVDKDAVRPDWNPVAQELAAACQARLHPGGAVLVVDYGGRGDQGPPRGFQGHAHAQPLSRPGEVDITASVDFAALERALGPMRFESLEEFLLRHGILDAINGLDRDTPEGASSYLRLRQLLLPTGLGAAFKVALFRPGEPSSAAAGRAARDAPEVTGGSAGGGGTPRAGRPSPGGA